MFSDIIKHMTVSKGDQLSFYNGLECTTEPLFYQYYINQFPSYCTNSSILSYMLETQNLLITNCSIASNYYYICIHRMIVLKNLNCLALIHNHCLFSTHMELYYSNSTLPYTFSHHNTQKYTNCSTCYYNSQCFTLLAVNST
mmetsp:Transcript_25233/g.4178  ORF Transcript_25233/g.4178 Transcript_25233/m.4178 type:complete len:142 (-) Transcript_25233:478-903(-)